MKTAVSPQAISVGNGAKRKLRVRLKLHYQLFIMLLVPLAFILVFAYAPMVGAVIAFKNYNFNLGIWDSEWVGLQNFIRFVRYPRFWNLIQNTLVISVYSLVAGFPMPIILALSLNCVRNRYFKKSVQMLTYLPYFISTVVLCGILQPANWLFRAAHQQEQGTIDGHLSECKILSPYYGLVGHMAGDGLFLHSVYIHPRLRVAGTPRSRDHRWCKPVSEDSAH